MTPTSMTSAMYTERVRFHPYTTDTHHLGFGDKNREMSVTFPHKALNDDFWVLLRATYPERFVGVPE